MKHHLYYESLDWGTYWKNFFRQDKDRFLCALREDFATEDIFLTRSGRTGIILSLKAFGLTREDEVLVPPFMSTCVLDSVNQVAMSSRRLTDRTKAVLFYHHWGYSQNYAKAQELLRSRKLWVIEDCAHGVWGRSQGISMGAFGHTAIFSLSKIFEMTYAGALRINDVALLSRIEEALSAKVSLKDACESLSGELTYLSFYNTPLARRKETDMLVGISKWYATLLMYPCLTTVRGRLARHKAELHEVFGNQNKHFLSLLKNARNRSFMLPGDEEATMAPLCFPILSDDEGFLNSVDQWLKQRNIFTGIYHFDVNRCMFNPDYKKCVPVPLYASLSDGLYEDFIRDFKGGF
ncbi:MAG: DegT/DnrJ/EryC1/StrS aminotransferase family protein [Candidatus Omnitrophica bacterium]|nr:DegT/DnrJ/EryC1/StrS aminotransferase family protein [Candidatus Omnitrophota bacterium]